MKITFHGAARTVTGSQHLLEVNGYKLLLECGLFQGRRQETYTRNQKLAYDPREIQAVLLSHAHIDHCGNLPNLVKQGFKGPIYATHVTCHLADIMLLDSGHIHEMDAQFINKKRAKRGEPPIIPLYTQKEAAQVKQYLQQVANNAPFEPVPGVSAQFVEAGHILGSAAVVLDVEENQHKHRLWFSGDIGRPMLPLVPDPELPLKAHTMLVECTYGHRVDVDPAQAQVELGKVIAATIARGGKVIVPAFAVGRTQELVYHLQQLIEQGVIPRIPVYVDSPLAVEVSQVFREHPEFFDQETRQYIQAGKNRSYLGFELLTYIQSLEESKELNERREPMVIISASGMAETGRILHHLRHTITDSRNTILIVSWQAPNTLGRYLADGEKRVKIFGEVYERRAKVVKLDGLSAHAGQPYLVDYVRASQETLKQVYLVHGEPDAAEAMRQKLWQVGIKRVYYPPQGEMVEV